MEGTFSPRQDMASEWAITWSGGNNLGNKVP